MLRIQNSLTGNKDEFRSIETRKVRIYVCGMTVYDYCHLGHARVMVVFDMVVRYLRARGFEVTYIRNITDIDDKIIKRAQENGETIDALTARFIAAMHEDAAALGLLAPEAEPRATAHIPEIIGMIGRLVEKKLAYQGENKDVYFDVSAFPEYGKLSGKKPDELRAGARVDIAEAKDDPLDFVLWKSAKPGEPQWDSPWGPGRPGWHIECSAMSMKCLGDHFDIHGGGQDLQFPHHENEIAQSEGATGGAFVNYWMHNGFVRVADEKMSKSLGNFFTVREVLAKYRPEVVRFFLLSSHYRSPVNYTDENLEEAKASLTRLYTALRDAEPGGERVEDYAKEFDAVMEDDFNTPRAIAVLHEIARALNQLPDKRAAEAQRLAGTLKSLGGTLGFLQADPDDFLQSGSPDGQMPAAEIEALIAKRLAARKAKDFQESDRIRADLAARGVLLEDGAQGTTWRRA
ncbi:MAG TPA: cysteine--tRNA ligase [Gammaproteobacteria bacterium]